MEVKTDSYSRDGFLRLLHERLAAAHLAGRDGDGFPASSLKLLEHYFDQVGESCARMAREEAARVLAEGYDGSAVRLGPNHSTIEIWYDTEEQARTARQTILDLMDAAAIRKG